jgi:hypothetical protein
MNDYRLLWKLKLKLRKWTTSIHVLFGFLCAALIPYYPVASVALLAGFAFDQWWEYKNSLALQMRQNSGKESGASSEADWWEGGVCSFAIGMGIVLILTLLKVYPLTK